MSRCHATFANPPNAHETPPSITTPQLLSKLLSLGQAGQDQLRNLYLPSLSRLLDGMPSESCWRGDGVGKRRW